MDKRQVKLGVYGFLIMLFVSMLTLKPYLPRALYHNFATIYDYQFFPNRVIEATNAKPWPIAIKPLSAPDAATQKLLEDTETTAVLVIENGQIVYEKYSNGGGVGVISNSFSVAKSILSLLYGVALSEGRVRSLEEQISKYLPEWEDRDEGKIKIHDLMRMASGLNWNESYWNPFSITAEAYYGRDLRMTALRQQQKELPGLHVHYASGSTQLLGLVLSRAVNENLATYLSKKLWGPLGAETNALWSLDHEDGMEKAFCCINATARDFARFGELVRLQGKWGGREFMSAAYLQEILTPNQLPGEDGKLTEDYGEQWWILKTPQGNIPYAHGTLGQYIVVVPQKNRVVVRLGLKSGNRNDDDPPELHALVNWVLSQ